MMKNFLLLFFVFLLSSPLSWPAPARAQLLLPPDTNLETTLAQFMDREEGPEAPAFAPGQAVPDVPLAPGLGYSGWKAPRLSAIPAKVVVLNLSSYFCPPCHREAPLLNALAALIRKRGLESRAALVTLSVGDGVEGTARFMREHNATWTFFPDPDFEAHSALGGSPVPAFLILRQGNPPVVLDAFIGELEQAPDAFLERILKLEQGADPKAGRKEQP